MHKEQQLLLYLMNMPQADSSDAAALLRHLEDGNPVSANIYRQIKTLEKTYKTSAS